MDLREASFSHRIGGDEIESLEIQSLLFGEDLAEDRATATQAFAGSAAPFRLHLTEGGLLDVNGGERRLSLYEDVDIADFVDVLPGRVAVDITGLEHRVWAPLIRGLLDQQRDVLALYAEPDEYQKSPEPLPGAVYDLSSETSIEPLPGFARVALRANDEGYFVPLLGFEGARLRYVIDREDVDVRKTFPIVGFPGFRMEYPAYAYLANRDLLGEDYLYRRVELARASCPFEAYAALERVSKRADGSYLRVAPLGTKPHALGAVLFALTHPENVELIYDHPVRSPNRTLGTGAVHVYEISAFMKRKNRRR